MLTLDSTVLTQVVNSAKLAAANEPRWLNAINRAAVELESNPFIERQDGHLLIGSPSGATYAANGICQCTAYAHGQPCWHRAAARLVRRHDEAQARDAAYRQGANDAARAILEDAEAAAAKARAAKRAAYAQAVAEMDELFA